MIIKVCHVLTRLDVGGLENGIVNLCNGHDRLRFEPSICCVKEGGLMAERLKPDVRVDILHSPEGKAPLRFLRLAKYFRATRPHIVHTHGWGQSSFDGILGAWLARVPVIINGEHGTFETKRHQVQLQRFLAMLCDSTLSVSYAHKKKVVETLSINPDRISVIHNGVDTDIFTGAYDTSSLVKELRSDFAACIDGNTFVIGCVGSIKPIKNQQLLLHAVAELKKIEPHGNFITLFIGQGPDLPMLRKLSDELGITREVVFLGQRKDIPELLSLIDVLVLPSQTGKEGLPNVVLEAFSSSMPVISTQSVGTHEVMVENETGWLLTSEDPIELCKRLKELMVDPNKTMTMGAKSQQHVQLKYSLQTMVEKYQHFYENHFESKL